MADGIAKSWAGRLWKVLVVLLAGAIAYGNTINVPFYFDDYSSIVNNPAIKNWRDTTAIWSFSPFRFVTYFSLALNYGWNGLNVAGYHIFNITIHLLAALSVYWLGNLLLKTENGRNSVNANPYLQWLPLLAALIFVLHPLHTQAVTYIVQRAASLAALLYVLALCGYVAGRLAARMPKRLLWWGGGLLMASAAMLTKQNAFTLPIAMALVELAFFSSSPGRKAAMLLLGGTVALLGLMALNVMMHMPLFSLSALQNLTAETAAISRADYFSTQLFVLWTYIGRFFWPVGLSLEYAIPMANSILEPRSTLSLVGHVLLLCMGALAWRKNRLAAYGIFFFYLAHTVESSIIPIRDLAFDHRTYLPDVGMVLTVGVIALNGAQRFGKIVLVMLACLLVLLGLTTWQRNAQWGNELIFYQNAAIQNPAKSRLWSMLADVYIRRDKYSEALNALQNAEKTREFALQGNEIQQVDQLNKVLALQGLGRREEAIAAANMALHTNPPPKAEIQAKLHINMGNVYLELNEFHEAESCFRKAGAMDPRNLNANANLAVALAYMGRMSEAVELLEDVQRKDPTLPNVADNLMQIRNAMSK